LAQDRAQALLLLSLISDIEAMKFAQGLLVLVSVLVRFSDAASLRGPGQVSLVSKDDEMPITKHNKEAGGDYNKGSPLFKKQEARKVGGVPTVKDEKPHAKADLKDGVSIKTPAEEDMIYPSTWWEMYGGRKNHVQKGLTTFISYFIFVMFTALIWMKCAGGRWKRVTEERKNTPLVGFAYGLFALDHCGAHHGGICIMAWCCAPLRLADTYAKEPFPLIASFWFALILVTTLFGLEQLTLGLSYLVFVLLAIYYRQQLRKQFGLPRGAGSWCTDLVTWCFCPCCAIAQEARQVDFVKKAIDPVPSTMK